MITDAFSRLPVAALLPEVLQELEQRHNLVLQAPPGAGKTTAVPLALLDAPWLQGRKILLLEPRRLAARAAAQRMASLLGEQVGERVGYRVSLERRVGPTTRIEVVTEGVLIRQLQSDAELADYGVVLFDEFHERSLNADLGLALCRQVQQFYRDQDPLKLVVMSATLDGARISQSLDDARLLTSSGRAFPVAVHYRDIGSLAREAAQWYPALVNLLRQLLNEERGDILLFLPGSGEIQRLSKLLQENPDFSGLSLCPLYGELTPEEQQRAIAPSVPGQRKLVLATPIAETSLTIEGVRIVVDSGLVRRPCFDPVSGMTRLDTQRISAASASQRAGRAGRVEDGLCYRLWSEGVRLENHSKPEMLEADLASLALELATWGELEPDDYLWLDSPPPVHYRAACELLEGLQALQRDARGQWQVSAHGRAMAELGMHPRLAHMVIRAKREGIGYAACQLAGLLSERDLLIAHSGYPDADIMLRLSVMEGEAAPMKMSVRHGALQRARQLSRQWQRQFRVKSSRYDRSQVACLLGWAYPDRIAQRRGAEPGRYRLANGKGASLPVDDAMAHHSWLVVAELGGMKNRIDARIFLACELDPALLREQFVDQIISVREVCWDPRQQQVVAQKRETLGALTVQQRRLQEPSAAEIQRALLQGVRERGIEALPWSDESLALRQRFAFAARFDTSIPILDDNWLQANLEQWLLPYLERQTRLEQLKGLDFSRMLMALLDWEGQQRLQQLAPERWTVASGSRLRIDYSDPEAPVLNVRLQELFGCATHPSLAGGQQPLTLSLLSPAQRPVQVTQDLERFWRGSYAEIKKEMKGRYPKHYWPDDPLQAEPTTRTKKHIKGAGGNAGAD
ncbi:ATP-dependent helicase HrpB [Aestuariirhabdus litorea]|uniref:ATP-dependent helicase HrpB n=1 Tax=Aestuariirhabdus litorea TaxID=2528527 RepID=A0A3P3VNF1_9GAMM|nr:ATP-dependent helicase HrpB [Aestuariirhabdus litorea]RRJ83176.1 ATP-dependent helicase HrpB [Aestuariirhabdus litorea]RWW93333.1 ATP-dependent helicase HrpB [Endozoicomonadaceae bacterium GTF-13]